MTILNNGTRNQYTATASQTVFAYSFETFDEDDITVYVDEAVQTITTDYTVSGVGNENGGNVTFVTGRTAGEVITLIRDTVPERTTDFQNSGEFLAAEINDQLDRIFAVIQELIGDGERSLQASDTTTTSSPIVFESAVAGQLLRWKNLTTVDSVAVPQDEKTVVTDAGGSRTLIATDTVRFTRFTGTGTINLTAPNNSTVSMAVNSEIEIRQAAASTITIVADSGVTVNAPSGGTLVLAGNGATVMLKKVATNEWDLIGQVVSA